jgi:hypothetical protein
LLTIAGGQTYVACLKERLMSRLDALLDTIARTEHCRVRPPAGLPVVRPGHRLPDEVVEFYRRCGGLTLYGPSVYRLRVLPPWRVVPTNPRFLDGFTEEQIEDLKPPVSGPPVTIWHRSWWFYTIARGQGMSDWITLDLNEADFGKLRDSFFAYFPFGPVIAASLTEFLERSLAVRGRAFYWYVSDEDDLPEDEEVDWSDDDWEDEEALDDEEERRRQYQAAEAGQRASCAPPGHDEVRPDSPAAVAVGPAGTRQRPPVRDQMAAWYAADLEGTAPGTSPDEVVQIGRAHV